MRYQKFKQEEISTLGLGGLRFPTEPGTPNRIDRTEGQKVVDAALAHGINYIDTAFTYQQGDSERFLGEALAKYPRDSYKLATKFYVAHSTDLPAVFEEQLRRCQTDYFDFYLLHCLDEETIDAYQDKKRGYLDYLLQQKASGRIRHIGFSSHAAPDTLSRFLDWYDQFDMALIQLNYLDWTLLDGKKQYEILTERQIPVWVMEPMKGGRLSTLSPKAASILQAAAPERSISSWGFRFLQGLPNVQTVLSGMSSVRQVEENARTFATWDPLQASEVEALQVATAIFLHDLGVPCSGCRYCCDTCPAGLDIPLLMQAYNEKRISGSSWKVPGLSKATDAAACLQCGACLSHCPQKIHIPEVLQQLASK